MNTLERTPLLEELPEFDINAAFQEAMSGVVNDEELELDEKVRRMETIVSEGTSEVYRDFVDFRSMAAQIEMMCNHDHNLQDSVRSNETLTSFMDSNKPEQENNEYEIDPKTGKKVKKKMRYVWLSFMFK